MDNNDAVVVQKQATVGDIVNAHINGMGGYEIAEKFGIDTEKVKQIINDADRAGKFIPGGVEAPIDKLEDVTPLTEGENPKTNKTTTKNNP